MKFSGALLLLGLFACACGSRTDLAWDEHSSFSAPGDGDSYSGDGDGDGDVYLGDGDGDVWGDGDGDAPPSACGDGIIDPWEQCDDGGLGRGDGCSPLCLWEVCGNAIVDVFEACDDGNFTNGDGCEPDCTISPCGNGVVDPGEACDDGNRVSGDGTCNETCTSNESCGNGVVDVLVGETCDDANLSWGDGCQPTCRLARCGDGFRDPNEICDDGNNTSGDGTCNATCMSNESCGNGIVDALRGEECDDANPFSGDGCQPNCRFQRCGDGYWDPGEACDDGNNTSGDGCRNDCSSNESCGNGIIDSHVGEICDDSNSQSFDGCDSTCRSDETCGNGKVDSHMGEDCDDGNIRAGGGCSSICTLELGTFNCTGEPSSCKGTFFDDFESYPIGTNIGAFSPSWRTWNSPHTPAEDSTVSSTNPRGGSGAICQTSSGAGPEDLVLPLGRIVNSGELSFGFDLYVGAGRGGYFNVQGGQEPADLWSAQFDFAPNGLLTIDRFGSDVFFGSYPTGRYFELRVDVDFDADVWEIFIEGVSQGAFYAANSAASYLDFFPANLTGGGAGGSFQCFDNVTYTISP